MTVWPVIAARSRKVKALPSRLASRSSSFVSCGSHDRRRTNVSLRLAGGDAWGDLGDTGLEPQQAVVVEERSSSVTNNGFPAVARSRSRSPAPGAAPVSTLAKAWTSIVVERTEADVARRAVATTLDQPVERGGHGDGRNEPITGSGRRRHVGR